MTPLFWRALLRHPLRHPWQLGLTILGIALGVAVVLAVDLANTSARRGFELAMNRITGHATHRILGGPQGVAETVYTRLRVEHGIRPAAPVVTGYLPRADHPGQLLQILGVDPFAEAPFRDLAADLTGGDFDLRALLLNPNAALLSEALGSEVTLKRGGQRLTLRRAGTLRGVAFEGLIVTDIATAQTLLGRDGRLDHIDLILPEGPAGEHLATELRVWLPPDLRLERPAERNQATADLSAAFSLNLTAMSLLALVVGMFLIYNAMTFSVVQRRALLGLLASLGRQPPGIVRRCAGRSVAAGPGGHAARQRAGGMAGIGTGASGNPQHQRPVLYPQRPRIDDRAVVAGQGRGARPAGDAGGGVAAGAGSRRRSAGRGAEPCSSGNPLARRPAPAAAGRPGVVGWWWSGAGGFPYADSRFRRTVPADSRLRTADAASHGRAGPAEPAADQPD
jgi:putative ABC transport system permease protein